MRSWTFLLVILGVAATTVFGDPGDTLYVLKTDVNVRRGPGIDNPVTMTLNKGDKVLEVARNGKWVHVEVASAGGKDGWIHASLIGQNSTHATIVAPLDARFVAFVADIDQLNDVAEDSHGFRFFTRVDDLGDGKVQLTAHDRWLDRSPTRKQGNLNILFKLWRVHERSGLPLSVQIVDARGELLMQKKSR